MKFDVWISIRVVNFCPQQDVEVSPEIIDAEKHYKLREELNGKLFHLKKRRTRRSIESEYLDQIIQVAENLADIKTAIQKESKMKEKIEVIVE